MNKEARFEILNGELIRANQNIVTSAGRTFRYGDGLFETIRVNSGKVVFMRDHLERLNKGMKILRIKPDHRFTPLQVEASILELVHACGFKSARIRLQVTRETGGYYTPEQNGMHWVISCEELGLSGYQLNDEGISLGLYNEELKSTGILSNLKTCNGLIYVLAGIYARENGYHDALIRNIDGKIIESVSSNIFIRIGNDIYTPPLTDGCIEGIMRKKVIELIEQDHKKIKYASVNLTDLINADEIILTNVINGLRWVKSVKGRSFSNLYSQRLIGLLNSLN